MFSKLKKEYSSRGHEHIAIICEFRLEKFQHHIRLYHLLDFSMSSKWMIRAYVYIINIFK